MNGMKHDVSFLTRCGIIFKRITGVKDISELRKNIKKQIGKAIYHKKYDADDIVRMMISLGMKKGSVVCIHAAMKEFYNYQGTAEELIDKILQVISPEGTLLMPAFPKRECILDENFVFDPASTPTAAGYLAETFRKMPGVIRSINTQHSVCAIGKYAQMLTEDHHRGVNCWDECSPWYRMTRLGALVFCLGLSANYIGTFDHCVEGLLYKEHEYWNQFFGLNFTFKYRNTQGNVETYTCRTGNIECRTRERNLTKHFGSHMRTRKLSNLRIRVYDSKECLGKMLELGRRGITMYYVPSPKGYKF